MKQKPQRFTLEHQKAISDEVDRLLEAGFIIKVNYLRWLSNVVLVKILMEAGGCALTILISIEHAQRTIIPSREGHELLTFMDVFSGYNQIRMAPWVQEYIAFITDRGVYCYAVMLFGLKNVGATYQRMVKMFKH